MHTVLTSLQTYSAWQAPDDWLAGVFAATLAETEDDLREKRRVKGAAWRAANRERAREIGREAAKRANAAKAIADGREPGVIGRPARVPPEVKRARKTLRAKELYHEKLDESRARAAKAARRRRASNAVAEGRIPGILGFKSTFTAEQHEQYERLWRDDAKVFYFRVKAHNSRAKKLGVPGEITVADVKVLFEQQAGHCAYCAKPFGAERPELDHWQPLARGGSNEPENIKLLHRLCNLTKATKLPATFAVEHVGLATRDTGPTKETVS